MMDDVRKKAEKIFNEYKSKDSNYKGYEVDYDFETETLNLILYYFEKPNVDKINITFNLKGEENE